MLLGTVLVAKLECLLELQGVVPMVFIAPLLVVACSDAKAPRSAGAWTQR